MPEDAGQPAAPRRAGFLGEGWRELRRKLARRALRRKANEQERERNRLLTELGRQAWQAKVDLSAFPDLSAPLQQLDERAGALGVTAKNLENERASLTDRRAAEVTRFAEERRPIEMAKEPADKALQSARAQHTTRERAVAQMRARLAVIPGELAALEQQRSSPTTAESPDQQGQRAAAAARAQQLQAERATLTSDLARAEGEIPGSAAEVSRLTAEANHFAEAIRQADAKRDAALAETDAALARVRSQLEGSKQQAAAVDKERDIRFAALGASLHQHKAAAAVLTGAMQQVDALDAARAANQSALESSLAETQAMPPGTMLKFSAVALLVPILLFAAVAAASSGFSPLSPSSEPERRQGSRSRKPTCEPLQKACEELQEWSKCAQRTLDDILGSVVTTRGQLDAELASRATTPQLTAVFQPQYLVIRQQLDAVIAAIGNAQGTAATAVAEAAADCALLPGPEDPARCKAAAERVQQKLKDAREKIERELDTTLAMLRAQGATWASIGQFLGQLEVQRTTLRRCP